MKRSGPLPRRRATKRRQLSPRCSNRQCSAIARIDGWCVSHAEKRADDLFSLWVRARDGRCTAQGFLDHECFGGLQAAHIEGRANKAVRYDPANVHALCQRAHTTVDQQARHAAKATWAIGVLGPDGYAALLERARPAGDRVTAISDALGWLRVHDLRGLA